MNSHEELRILVSAYCDGETNPAETALVQAHLRECPECAAVLQAYRRLGTAVQELPQEEPSPALWGRVRQALPERRGGLLRPGGLFRRYLLPVASALALLALGITVVLLSGTVGRDTAGVRPSRQAAPAEPGTGESAGINAAEETAPTAAALEVQTFPAPEAAPVPTAPAPPEAFAGLSPCPGQVLAVELEDLSTEADQTLTSPEVTGRLLDAQDHPLAGVTVVISSTTGWQSSTVTDAEGGFSIELPEEGDFRLLAMAPAEDARTHGYDELAEEEGAWESPLELPEVGACLARWSADLPQLSLGAQDRVFVRLRVR